MKTSKKNEKNGKNGKKREKMKKNNEKRKKNEEIWIQTQNSLRFPWFTVVVVVTFFVEILDDFHDFVSECVSFQRKINNPFWEVIVFPSEK